MRRAPHGQARRGAQAARLPVCAFTSDDAKFASAILCGKLGRTHLAPTPPTSVCVGGELHGEQNSPDLHGFIRNPPAQEPGLDGGPRHASNTRSRSPRARRDAGVQPRWWVWHDVHPQAAGACWAARVLMFYSWHYCCRPGPRRCPRGRDGDRERTPARGRPRQRPREMENRQLHFGRSPNSRSTRRRPGRLRPSRRGRRARSGVLSPALDRVTPIAKTRPLLKAV